MKSKYYLDAGTTYSKIIEILEDGTRKYRVLPSNVLKTLGLTFEKSCGHMMLDNENEIVALAKGVKGKIEPNSTVLDMGSRDAKWIRFKSDKFRDMDWNNSCASSTGATIEMLLKFYNVEVEELKANSEKYAVTCGIFGLEKIMDDISHGLKPKEAISKFVHGIAYNAWNFCKKPEKIYLSGGFCENECFVESLKKYCEVVNLGRFVLCEGLLDDGE